MSGFLEWAVQGTAFLDAYPSSQGIADPLIGFILIWLVPNSSSHLRALGGGRAGTLL